MTAPPTMLVLRALGLGDFFTGLPALRILRRARPEHRIVLAVPPAFADLAGLSGSVDATVAGHELTPLIDPPHRPDLAVDLHGNGPGSRALLAVTRPSSLLSFGPDGPVWRPDEHEVARWCRLVLDGLPADGPVPSVAGCLPLPPDAGVPAGLTVVHCGAKSAARRWPADRFAAVARALAVSGLDVVVTGGVTERAIAERIAADSGTRAVTDLDLAHLISLVGQARLLVCGDTGVAHVASNYRTPSVVLFGPVSPAVWGPPADPRHQVLWHGDGRGDPHGPVLDPALARISVDEVLLACDRALAVDPDRPERVGVAP